MKAFIWIVSFFVFSFLNMLLGEATGFRVGAVLIYLLWYFSCRAMCNAWDRRKSARDAEKAKRNTLAAIRNEIPVNILNQCESMRGNYDLLKSELNYSVKNKDITRAQAKILLTEYARFRRPSSVVSYAAAPETTATRASSSGFCRICGEPLLQGSNYCRKCGAEVEAAPPSSQCHELREG